MPQFEFSLMALDEHVENIGVDVRPPIDIRADRLKIQDYYNQVSDALPHLFESLVQGPAEFRIQKTLPVVGKGRLDITTFTLTPRGPVFTFPRIIPDVGEDFLWSKDLTADVLQSLARLQQFFPMLRFVRIGKVRTLVFSCGKEDSNKILRERFARNLPPGSVGLSVGWNQSDEQYNRKIQVNSVRKGTLTTGKAEVMGQQQIEPTGEYGIRVTVDVNNLHLDKALEQEELRSILNYADRFFHDDLINVLNGRGN